MKTAFLIPVYNHGATLKTVISSLENYRQSVIVIDDGNNEENRELIDEAVSHFKNSSLIPEIILVKNEKNLGKGASVINGVKKAAELGFTHIFQLDSDGQHDTGAVSAFLEASEKNPNSIICGYPEYDESVPKIRLNGRKICAAWIHIVTLSRKIKDAMIGFRIYPVEAFMKLIEKKAIIDSRMAYDMDSIVQLSWMGINIVSLPVKIRYPLDGVSNFRMFKDNVRISWMFTRLCATMLVTWPVILYRNKKAKN